MKKATLLLSLLLAVLMVFSSCDGGESEITTDPEIALDSFFKAFETNKIITN